MQYIHDAHCVYGCDYHIVLCTKYRRKVINEGFGAYLKEKAYEVTHHYPKLKIKEFNHEEDHVHLLVSIPPSMSVGSFILPFFCFFLGVSGVRWYPGGVIIRAYGYTYFRYRNSRGGL
ncbi:MAG: IS200/IS605 family transposase [Candidatus Moranbacteria bacterium]|nr:IS200/IS605 family transposase [Candidatus Moranbacteria bacterium]